MTGSTATGKKQTEGNTNRLLLECEIPVSHILGIPVALLKQSEIIEAIQFCLDRRIKGWITGVNGHALNLAYVSEHLQDFYRNAALNCSEGFGVVLSAFISGVPVPKRVVWADWAYELLRMFEQRHYSVFLLGATEDVSRKAVEQLKHLYPDLTIAGRLNGYGDMIDNDSVLRTINKAKPDVVFVALGMPKQEEWIHRYSSALEATLIFPVGALIDYLSGDKMRCPHWMSSLGLEWLFRLLLEPKKVWRRYLIGNPQLLWRACRARFHSTR